MSFRNRSELNSIASSPSGKTKQVTWSMMLPIFMPSKPSKSALSISVSRCPMLSSIVLFWLTFFFVSQVFHDENYFYFETFVDGFSCLPFVTLSKSFLTYVACVTFSPFWLFSFLTILTLLSFPTFQTLVFTIFEALFSPNNVQCFSFLSSF